MTTARVTAIVVTYNSADDVDAALTALRPVHLSHDLDCIVVDNRSSDQTVSVVRERHPWATLVESAVNMGYGRGINRGIRDVTSDYVLILNPDAVLAADGLLDLVRFLDQNPRAAVVGPAIVEGDGAVQSAGGLPTPWRVVARSTGIQRFVRPQQPIRPGGQPFKTDWLCGAILLVRRRMLEEIGRFDPRFFLYFEETDVCRRLLQAGHEIWAVGEVTAYHANNASAKRSGAALFAGCIAEHYFQSRFYYLRKHYGWFLAAGTEVVELLFLSARALLGAAGLRGGADGLSKRLTGSFFTAPKAVE